MSPKNMISFLLDGELQTINFSLESTLKPSTTVLNYLRGLSGHKGVKEGCAEGDCGACTIVVAEAAAKNKLKYQAYDSCLVFLPMIHGKQLITVENLAVTKGNETELHPVQQLIVNLNGSQCGYCTPGIVMSLFALYKNHDHPNRETAEDALTGNLCRCTGYQPILNAAIQACTHKGVDHFSNDEKSVSQRLTEILKDTPSVHIETKSQKYFRPSTFKEALEIRAHHPEAIVINGATDIALRQTKKHEFLPVLLDLSGIGELKFFREENDGFYIGSGLSMESLRNKSEAKIPALSRMLSLFASLQIRNLATIGGNVGSASPIGDTLPVLFASNARIVLARLEGERTIGISDFIKGYRHTDIKSDELIQSVIIPKAEKKVIIHSYKVSKRKDMDISTVCAGFRLKINNDGMVEDIHLAYGGMAECTKRAVKTEAFLYGKKWVRETVESAMLLMNEDFTPISDARAGKEFRMIAARNLLLKFFIETQNIT